MLIGRGPESVRDYFCRNDGEGEPSELSTKQGPSASVEPRTLAELVRRATDERLWMTVDDSLDGIEMPPTQEKPLHTGVPSWFQAGFLVERNFQKR
jgi:hypothetical protein